MARQFRAKTSEIELKKAEVDRLNREYEGRIKAKEVCDRILGFSQKLFDFCMFYSRKDEFFLQLQYFWTCSCELLFQCF